MTKTRTYRREQYACHLEVKPYRLRMWPAGRDHAMSAMTRWLRRLVRDGAIVMGTAMITLHEEFMTGRVMLRAVANAYQGVHPDDANILEKFVDADRGQMVIVPVMRPLSVKASTDA